MLSNVAFQYFECKKTEELLRCKLGVKGGGGRVMRFLGHINQISDVFLDKAGVRPAAGKVGVFYEFTRKKNFEVF